jgi:membrane-bound inhibitor of C-type lysozyme
VTAVRGAVLLLALTGCGRQGVQVACADGARIMVIATPSAVQLRIGDTTRTLTLVQSASGARYSDGTLTYWSRGNESLLMLGDSIIHGACKAVH